MLFLFYICVHGLVLLLGNLSYLYNPYGLHPLLGKDNDLVKPREGSGLAFKVLFEKLNFFKFFSNLKGE